MMNMPPRLKDLLIAVRHFFVQERAIIALVFIAMIMSTIMLVRSPNMTVAGLSHIIPVHNFFSGQGFSIDNKVHLYHHPGYGIFSYIFYLLVRDIEYSGMLSSASSYILIIIIIYYTVRFLFGRNSAILAAFMVTFCPTLIVFSKRPFPEYPYALFLILSFSVYVRIIIDRSTIKRNILLGGLLGFSYLIRPEGFLVALLALSSLFILANDKEIENPKELNWINNFSCLHFLVPSRRWINPVAAVMAFLMIALPYVFFLHKHTGIWTFSNKTGENLYWGEKAVEGKEYARLIRSINFEKFGEAYSVNVIDYVRSRGGKILVRIQRNLASEFLILSRMTLYALFPLFVLCLLSPFFHSNEKWKGKLNNSRNRRIALSFFIFLSPLAGLSFFWSNPRYLFPYSIYILMILAFLTVLLLERHIFKQQGEGSVRYGLYGCMVMSFLIVSGMISFHPIIRNSRPLFKILTKKDRSDFRQAGLWVYHHVRDREDIKILTPEKEETKLKFYVSGKKGIKGVGITFLPEAIKLKDIALSMQSGQADYLLLTRHSILNKPQFDSLWNNSHLTVKYGLELIHHHDDGKNSFQIYSFLNKNEKVQ